MLIAGDVFAVNVPGVEEQAQGKGERGQIPFYTYRYPGTRTEHLYVPCLFGTKSSQYTCVVRWRSIDTNTLYGIPQNWSGLRIANK